jgi:hypothetical protein
VEDAQHTARQVRRVQDRFSEAIQTHELDPDKSRLATTPEKAS